MLDETELARAVVIQQRTYRLLRWLAAAMKRGFVSFHRAHEYTSAADAAADWIEQHFLNLPEDCRPDERSREALVPFATFLTSYVVTSFDLVEEGEPRLVSECGCFCPVCSYVTAGPELRAKRVTASHKKRAALLKRAVLNRLATEASVFLDDARARALLADRALSRSAALVAYGQQLLTRCRGQDEGPAVLALWREIAWSPAGSPIKGFQLDPAAILAAERALSRAITG